MTETSVKMPTVSLGKYKISRLLAGGNQMGGASHNLRDLSGHMIEYFTVERIVDFVKECLKEGINSWQGNYGPKTIEVMKKLRAEGLDINLFPLSAPQLPGLTDKQLRHIPRASLVNHDHAFDKIITELKPTGVIFWGSVIDVLYKEGQLNMAQDFLKKIRQAGVQVGVATHMPEVIEYIEEKDWDIDFFFPAIYKFEKQPEEVLKILPEIPLDVDRWASMQVILPSERVKMCNTIRQSRKMCIAFKIMAAGRAAGTPEQVRETFEYVFGHIKPTDAVCVGMYPRFHTQMIKENADFVKRYG